MIKTSADLPNLLGYEPGIVHADDRQAFAWGYAHSVMPATRVGFPKAAGPYSNAGPAPTMGFLGALVTGVLALGTTIATGILGNKGASTQAISDAALAEAMAAQAEADVTVARYAAEAETARGKTNTNMLIIGGGMALAAVVLVMAMKR